jgi:hypothetical protein
VVTMRPLTHRDRNDFVEVVASGRPSGDSFVEDVAILSAGVGDE